MAEKKARSGVLHFSISGEFITRHTRRLWAEGAASMALKTLMTGLQGMNETIALKILTGHKKLTGWNSRIKLEDDNATKDDRGLPLPRSLHEVLSQKDHALEKEQREHRKTAMMAAGTFTRLEDAVLDPRSRHDDVSTLEAVAEIIGPDPKPVPTTAWTDWTCGWLTPEGLFYGCQYGGHQNLCGDLEVDSFQIERKGWLKLQRKEWVGYFGKDPITQKQIDALYDWSEATGKKIPLWVLDPKADL
jgi:hypothetical protein